MKDGTGRHEETVLLVGNCFGAARIAALVKLKRYVDTWIEMSVGAAIVEGGCGAWACQRHWGDREYQVTRKAYIDAPPENSAETVTVKKIPGGAAVVASGGMPDGGRQLADNGSVCADHKAAVDSKRQRDSQVVNEPGGECNNTGNKDGEQNWTKEYSYKHWVTIDGEGVEWTKHSDAERLEALMLL
ncbi:hypothetical protein Tco_0333606 [Tanacetum coccineum]